MTHPNQHTPTSLRRPKRRGKLVSLTDDERATLEAGAKALGETTTQTLRQGGLIRAEAALRPKEQGNMTKYIIVAGNYQQAHRWASDHGLTNINHWIYADDKGKFLGIEGPKHNPKSPWKLVKVGTYTDSIQWHDIKINLLASGFDYDHAETG